MNEKALPKEKKLQFEEITPNVIGGIPMLLLNIILMLASVAGIIFAGITLDADTNVALGVILLVAPVRY